MPEEPELQLNRCRVSKRNVAMFQSSAHGASVPQNFGARVRRSAGARAPRSGRGFLSCVL